MRFFLGLSLACLLCLVSVPVHASSLGITPAAVVVQLHSGSSATFRFIVSGHSGLVEISSSGMPATVSPASVNVVNGTPIEVVVTCNDGASAGLYDGRILFVAKSNGDVLAGVNAICRLTVLDTGANVTLTATVVGNNGNTGGLDSGDSHGYTPPDWSSIFPTMNQPQSSASSYTPPQETYIPIPAPTTTVVSSNIPSEPPAPIYTPVPTTPTMDKAVWAGILFWAIAIGLFVWFLSWLVDRRRNKTSG